VSPIVGRVDHAPVPDIRQEVVEPVLNRLPRCAMVLSGQDGCCPAPHLACDWRPTGNEGLTAGNYERMF